MLAKKNISLKANKALFSIKQNIFDSSIRPSAVLHLFDSLIKPIVLYNSIIVIGYKTCFQKTIDEKFDMSFKGTNEFNNILTRFSIRPISLMFIQKLLTLQCIVNLV